MIWMTLGMLAGVMVMTRGGTWREVIHAMAVVDDPLFTILGTAMLWRLFFDEPNGVTAADIGAR